MEIRARQIQDTCKWSCNKYIQRKESGHRKSDEWWSENLSRLKSETNKARRFWQISREERDKRPFVELRGKYKQAINRTKKEYITREIDDQIESDPSHRGWHSKEQKCSETRKQL